MTDLPRERAEHLLERLRAFRPIAARFLPGEPNASDPALTIVLFARPADFRRVVGNLGVTGFMQPSLAGNLLVVGPDNVATTEHETLLHEYTHYLLRTRSGLSLPAWYDEGLASFLGATEFDSAEVVVGALPQRRLEDTLRAGRLDLARSLEAEDLWRWRGDRRRAFYAWSWLLVHRLQLGHEAGLADAREALHRTVAGAAQPLTEALATSPRQLQRELERYLTRSARPRRYPLPPLPDVHREHRCLDHRERSVTLSLAMLPGNSQAAVTRLSELADRLPTDATAWVHLSLAEEHAGNRDGAVAAARRARALDDGEDAAIRLAGALTIGCILTVSEACRSHWREAVPLLREALRRDPYRHDAVFLLGLAYLYSGRPGEALNYLRIAHGRQPWASHVNFYLGESYRLIGDSRSRAHLQRARAWSTSELWRLLADAALTELDGR